MNQSPLYNLKGKGQLEKALGLSWDEINQLSKCSTYNVWINDNNREIQHPIGKLAKTHAHIRKLLARIEKPEYLLSRKGRSYVDNAREHVGYTQLIKTDIRKFYPSTTREMVYRMFRTQFNCVTDIAHSLADLCCYKQLHLPTGSPLSDYIAFFTAKPMFDEIALLSQTHHCKMTVYVDDLTISGSTATKTLLGKVRQTISRYGYKTKQSKAQTYSSHSAKTVTGAIIVGNELKLPNARHEKIHKSKIALEKASLHERPALLRNFQGRQQEAKQILGIKP